MGCLLPIAVNLERLQTSGVKAIENTKSGKAVLFRPCCPAI